MMRRTRRAWADAVGNSLNALSIGIATVKTFCLGVVILIDVQSQNVRYDMMEQVAPLWMWGVVLVASAVWLAREGTCHVRYAPTARRRLFWPVAVTCFLHAAVATVFTLSLGLSTALPMYGSEALAMLVVLVSSTLPPGDAIRRERAARRR